MYRTVSYLVEIDPEERRVAMCLATLFIFSSHNDVYNPPKVQNLGRVSAKKNDLKELWTSKEKLKLRTINFTSSSPFLVS